MARIPDVIVAADSVLRFWGSDCLVCGNTTLGSLTCDECNSDLATVALYMRSTSRKENEPCPASPAR